MKAIQDLERLVRSVKLVNLEKVVDFVKNAAARDLPEARAKTLTAKSVRVQFSASEVAAAVIAAGGDARVSMQQIERCLVEQAITSSKDLTAAAAVLGVSRKAFFRLTGKHGIKTRPEVAANMTRHSPK